MVQQTKSDEPTVSSAKPTSKRVHLTFKGDWLPSETGPIMNAVIEELSDLRIFSPVVVEFEEETD